MVNAKLESPRQDGSNGGFIVNLSCSQIIKIDKKC